MLRRPASKKRQGTKSREVWGRVGSQRYGDLIFASIMTVGAKLAQLARETGVLKMGTVALDGTKIHANASRHSALSYEHAGKIEAQLKAEVADLMAKAEAADAADIPDGMSIPDELARREDDPKAEVDPHQCAPAAICDAGDVNSQMRAHTFGA